MVEQQKRVKDAFRKAVPVPISLKPKHVLMLAALEKELARHKSGVIQYLIEESYKKSIIAKEQ